MTRIPATVSLRPPLMTLLTACSFLVACSDDSTTGTGPPPLSANMLRLPVRVHLVTSRLDPIGARFGAGEVWELMERVNEIWSQAEVLWEIEAITREFVRFEDELEAVLLAGRELSPGVLAAILPRGRLFEEGWDVFLIHDMARAGGSPGIYFTFLPAAVSSEVDPAGLNDPGRILAHELGHSLTLPHVSCASAGNLMAANCASHDRTRLSTGQIDQARAQAKIRRPHSS